MSWGRYDTLGSTVYLAADPAAAFHEVMAPFALDLGAKNPLQKDADALGISLKTLMQEIAHDWDEKNYMNTGCLPAQWSYDRKLYTISMTHPLPWVDVQRPNSIGAIRQAIGSDLAKETGITSLTLNELTSPNREVTTRIAEWIRNVQFDTLQLPTGVIYPSKLGGTCYAIWLHGRDAGVSEEPFIEVSTEQVITTMPGLQTASKRLGINCF